MRAEAFNEASVVADDLAFLMDTWEPRLDHGELRRSISILLRRLLVEGQYQRAWRSLGLPAEPYVTAPSLEQFLGQVDPAHVHFAFPPPGETVRKALAAAGGQMTLKPIEDIPVGAFLVALPGYLEGGGIIFGAVPPAELAGLEGDAAAHRFFISKFGRQVRRGQPLSAFLSSAAAQITRVNVSRTEVIKYVANKLGGAHFDPRRPGEAGARLALLDQIPAQIRLAPLAGRKPARE